MVQFTDKDDHLLLMLPVLGSPLKIISNQQNVYVIQSEQFQAWGKDGPGDLLVELSSQEWLRTFIG
ncbi:hypothetical protein IQE94_18115 (plasmid) [Synechocystis sp. PCC 7339]|uniref:hypothetical protein n=1 Tax=Synechocystis sp. PCC 7339 TaxID=2782213 RepID=UPI001CBFFEC3|nr:hypothetical protein [Synechocystis sp. PCC 7339]UAJ74583.1 hypothetical protein IQE94_18115 [Synechocystis sp. PCC 7339]